jgi:chromosome segregation ATPase
MDKAKDEAINKLIAGQEMMGKDISWMKVDISVIKEDISDLKNGQETMRKDISGMKEDISYLKNGQESTRKEISELKTDVSELNQGQQHLETMMLRLIEEVTFVKRVVVSMENDFKPQVRTLFDADKVRQHDTTELKQICREQEDRIEDHELRISRLEK